MAVPTLPKLKAIKLTKLQALLLLGGAFVLAVAAWVSLRYRLVADQTREAPAASVLALQFLPRDKAPLSDEGAQAFVRALPAEAQEAIKRAAPGRAPVLFATPGQGAELHWELLGGADARPDGRPAWRLVPKADDAIGFVALAGRRQPLEATFGADRSTFRVGRSYRGLVSGAPSMNAGRRMRVPLNQESFYLEKPETASWAGSSALLGSEMQRFPGLSAFWTLPGRVELSVSASRTPTVFQPFSLYYRPTGTLTLPRTALETYAKDLLADALPHPIDVSLPDGTHMEELRRDLGGIVALQRQNQFGDIVKFAYPGQKEAIYAFYAKDGEAWLTTDLSLVQSVLLGTIDASLPEDECHKGGTGGFAVLPASFLPVQNGFKDLTISIHNLETGVFTICGYY